jgi:HAMP domain-containing protein
MDWIKRNLFFFIGTVVAMGLLAAAGIYGFGSWQRNETALNALHAAYKTLQTLNNENPSPGNDRVNNIQAAREQERQLREWIQQTKQHFQPISPIPNPTNGVVTSEAFAAALRRMVDQLQREADGASVTLPPQYNFSFEAERSLVKFTPDGLPSLAQQLGGVKEICETLFSAKINSLDGLRRVSVSDDDARGSQSDYLDGAVLTNNLAIFTPYEVTFRCFSQDLANALSGFASSSRGFIVKDISVRVAEATTTTLSTSPLGERMPGNPMPPYAQPTQPAYQPPSAPVGRDGLQTMLKEQLLSVTMKIVVVKLLPEI